MFLERNSYTTFSFSLPLGLLDSEGTLHQDGEMRLATGKDELYVQRDPRSLDNPAYGTLVMLSRVILRLGDLSSFAPEDLEGLFLNDWQYLLNVYNLINPPEGTLSTMGEF